MLQRAPNTQHAARSTACCLDSLGPRDDPRPSYWYQQYFTTAYFSEAFVCRFWLSPTYEFVLSWPDVGCDLCHPDLYTSPVTLAHSHTPTYTIRTLCVCPITTTALQKLRYTKDPYEVFQCVSGTYREQQSRPRSSVFRPCRSTPPPKKNPNTRWTDVTQPLQLQFGSDQLQPSSSDEADGLQLAVLAEVVATDETRPLPHYGVSEQPQYSKLDESELARLAVLAELVSTHCHALLWKHA